MNEKKEILFNLKFDFYKNYFVKNKQGKYSINDIINLMQANYEEFYDCVELKNGVILYNDKFNYFNCNCGCGYQKKIETFIFEYQQELEHFFKIEGDFLLLSDEEKYNYMDTFFDLAYHLQENETYIETTKKNAIYELQDFELSSIIDCNDLEFNKNKAIKSNVYFVRI